MSDLKISLAAARVNAEMSQTQVAQALHVSRQTIVNWESGRTAPSYASLEAMARLYSIPIDNIFLPVEST